MHVPPLLHTQTNASSGLLARKEPRAGSRLLPRFCLQGQQTAKGAAWPNNRMLAMYNQIITPVLPGESSQSN